MPSSPTARSLQHARKRGYLAGVVERRIPKGHTTIDLFGFCDLIIVGAGRVIFVQVTGGTGGNHAARIHKVAASADAQRVCQEGANVEVWSWAKRGPRGSRKLWTLRRTGFAWRSSSSVWPHTTELGPLPDLTKENVPCDAATVATPKPV